MKTAVDTSVIYSILNGEPDAKPWMALLVKARREGQLVACEVVFAELAPAFSSQTELQETLGKLGIGFEEIGVRAAFLAGQAFTRYRARGGPRDKMIPDFLIAGHAAAQADRLAAADRGFVRNYFTSVQLIMV